MSNLKGIDRLDRKKSKIGLYLKNIEAQFESQVFS